MLLIKFEGSIQVLKYTLRRLLYLIFVFFIVSIIMFGIHYLIPGDPVSRAIEEYRTSLKPHEYDAMYWQTYREMGYDQPVPVQYLRWMERLLQGDLGYSTIYRRPVNQVIGAPIVNTLKLNLISTAIVFAITIPLGIVSAVKKGSLFDRLTQGVTILGYSLPTFVFAILFIFLFSVHLGWFPVSGMATPGFSGTALEMTLDRLKYMALPVLTLVFISLGGLTRYVRTTMIEALSEDYIKTARAKGLRERVVIFSNAFRNALIPFITVMTVWIISLFSGSIITETMFNYNGIGKMLYDALRQSDYQVVMSMNMFYVLLSLLGNLFMDLAYGIADPRVRLA